MDSFLETSNSNIVVLFNYHKAKKVFFFYKYIFRICMEYLWL